MRRVAGWVLEKRPKGTPPPDDVLMRSFGEDEGSLRDLVGDLTALVVASIRLCQSIIDAYLGSLPPDVVIEGRPGDGKSAR